MPSILLRIACYLVLIAWCLQKTPSIRQARRVRAAMRREVRRRRFQEEVGRAVGDTVY